MSGVINAGNKIGRGIAGVRLVMASCVALSLCSIATALVTKKNEYTARARGKVVSKDCIDGANPPECRVGYEYTVRGKTYKNGSTTRGNETVGDAIDVNYVPASPGDSTLQIMPAKKIAMILYALATCMLCIGYLTYALTKHVKGAGTLVAASTAYSFFN